MQCLLVHFTSMYNEEFLSDLTIIIIINNSLAIIYNRIVQCQMKYYIFNLGGIKLSSVVSRRVILRTSMAIFSRT